MAAPAVGNDGSQGIAQNALSARIALAAQRGQISSLDRVALGNALTAIKGDFVSSIADGESRLSPYEMKARIESLIDAQIAGGTLSQSQGAQLRGFYSSGPSPSEDNNNPADDQPRAVTAPPLAVTASAQDTSSAAEARADEDATPDAGDELDALVKFMDLLRQKMETSRNGYGSAASSFPVRRSPLVVDTLA
jgi:hypothetical protein